MSRKNWPTYFMDIAKAVSTRATCARLHVGCVLVEPGTRAIVATGYNGSVHGMPHCDDAGHDMDEGHCVRTVHAEQNAITQAARRGVRIEGTWAYVTAYPCWLCAKLLLNSGVSFIIYGTAYRKDPRVEQACAASGVQIVQLDAASEGA